MHLKSYWLFFFPMKISYSNCLFCQHQEFKSSFRNHINAMAGLLQQFRFAFSMDYKCEITLSRKYECSHIWIHWLKNSAITFNLYDKVLYSVASTVVFNNYDWMVWQINTKVEGM